MARLITLSRQRDFDKLFDEGTRFRDELMMTVVRLRSDDGPARVAFIVGKRVDKRAVVRNRIKRRLREAWRGQLPNVSAGVDIAFVAHPPAAAATYHDLAAVLCQHLSEAGVVT
jgi:ribonuclease P protein component